MPCKIASQTRNPLPSLVAGGACSSTPRSTLPPVLRNWPPKSFHRSRLTKLNRHIRGLRPAKRSARRQDCCLSMNFPLATIIPEERNELVSRANARLTRCCLLFITSGLIKPSAPAKEAPAFGSLSTSSFKTVLYLSAIVSFRRIISHLIPWIAEGKDPCIPGEMLTTAYVVN